MRFESEKELSSHIKSDKLLPVYLLYGSQSYLVKLYAKKLREKAADPANAQWNVTVYDASKADIDTVADTLQSVSFFGGSRCVELTDLDVEKLSAAEWEKCKRLLGDLPEESVLIISLGSVLPDFKKTKWKTLLKAIEAAGASAELGSRSKSDTARFITALCRKNGCYMSPDVCQRLIELCGDDLAVLSQEAQKICSYQGEGEVSIETVEKLTVRRLDDNVFDLSRKILRKDLTGALNGLEDLLNLGNDPVAILGALDTVFIDLYRCKAAKEKRLSAKEISAAFNYGAREFRVRNALKDADRLSLERLGGCIGILAKTDYALRSSRTSAAVLLQQGLVQLFLALHQREAQV